MIPTWIFILLFVCTFAGYAAGYWQRGRDNPSDRDLRAILNKPHGSLKRKGKFNDRS